MSSLSLFDKFHAAAQRIAAAAPERIRIAINEQDGTTEPDPEAQEHFKVDGCRVGRDFKLSAFMAVFSGPEAAVTDFAETAVRLSSHVPAASAVVNAEMVGLATLLPEGIRDRWIAIWDTPAKA